MRVVREYSPNHRHWGILGHIAWTGTVMSNTAVRQILRQIPYFAQIEEAHVDDLSRKAIHHSFVSDELIYFEGEPSAGLWIVESGRVKAYKSGPDGQEYIMRIFGPGDTFNDLAALDGSSNPVSTVAITDVSAWRIPSNVFVQALQDDHQLAISVLYGMIGRIRYLVGQLEDLALRPVTARLARFLLEQASSDTLSDPSITRALVADYLATTPETISRSLRALEKMGAIRFDRHNIVIVKPDMLRDLARID